MGSGSAMLYFHLGGGGGGGGGVCVGGGGGGGLCERVDVWVGVGGGGGGVCIIYTVLDLDIGSDHFHKNVTLVNVRIVSLLFLPSCFPLLYFCLSNLRCKKVMSMNIHVKSTGGTGAYEHSSIYMNF